MIWLKDGGVWVGEGRRGGYEGRLEEGEGFGVDAALPTAFVKIIKHFFPVQNSFYVFVFWESCSRVTTPRSARWFFTSPSPVWFFFLKSSFEMFVSALEETHLDLERTLAPSTRRAVGGRLLLGRVRGISFLFLTLGFPAEGFVFASAAVDERERPAAPLFLFLLVWIFSLIFGVFLWFPVVSLKLGARSSVRRFRLDVTNDGFANDVFDSWWGSGGREEGRTTF